MEFHPRNPVSELTGFGHSRLWVLGLLFFGVGDSLTTLLGLWMAGVGEANPVLAPLLEHGAILVIGGFKLLFVLGCFVLWKVIPRPYSIGVPLALILVGAAVTVWNLSVLAVASFGLAGSPVVPSLL